MSSISQRKDERVPSKVIAKLLLPDGQVHQGITRDMGFGGVFLVTPLPPGEVPRGTSAKLAMDIFGRQVEMECQVAHVTEEGFGLKLARVSP